jgi:hypothetical protein
MSNNCLNISSSVTLINDSFTTKNNGCGDIAIDLGVKLSKDISELNTLQEFNTLLYSELIDVKNRQSISAYPTLRLIYERYLTNDNCTNQSNGFNYDSMDLLTQSIGTYWVDLIEQFIPATTIWGSTYVYRNTIFDTPKYAYKSNTLWLCDDPSDYFPFSALSKDCETEVIKVSLPSSITPDEDSTPFDNLNFFSCPTNQYCDCVWTMTNYCNSEFLGRILEINVEPENTINCEDSGVITDTNILITQSKAVDCNVANETWDSINRIYSQIVKVTDTSNIPISIELDYLAQPYGVNSFGITFEVIKLDTNTLRIDWLIPISAPEPIQTNCTGYYTNQIADNTQLFGYSDIWDVKPIINIKTEEGCEITSVFVGKGKFIRPIRPVVIGDIRPIGEIERNVTFKPRR